MYQKIVKWGHFLELFTYENEPRPHIQADRRKIKGTANLPNLALHRPDNERSAERITARRKDNAKRAVLAFRRLVECQLSEFTHTILITLTYSENMQDFRRGRKDFNSFARAIRRIYGPKTRYICVQEFQKRGAIHFHALFWGLPAEVVGQERIQRTFAVIWSKGFVDLALLDTSNAIAGYMAKYMEKTFLDPKFAFIKAYIASQNISRPVIDKRPILSYWHFLYELSTPCIEKDFDTQWLGKCNYKKFVIEKKNI